uniref:Retrotransposon gag domain-containing protein n=1 Tax=Chenopodium quinoa TaxID=63459 RepID=A0A803N8Q3_CHEQI
MVKFYEENKAFLAKVKRYLGLGNDDLPPSTVRESVQLLSEQLNEMNGMIQNMVGKQREMFSPNGTPLYKDKEIEMEAELNYLREELSLIRKAVEEKTASHSAGDRAKVPESKAFDGSRDSKALENFIWDLEHYFKVTNRGDGGKVDLAALYLSGDAKLWWTSRQEAD